MSSSSSAPTDTDRPHPLFARIYAPVRRAMDRGGLIAYRRALLADLDGVVVEVGAGDGGNLPHYPSTVQRVIAVEPEPRLRAAAAATAEALTTDETCIEVVPGLAESLPVESGSADAVVFTLVLCSVPDVAAAMGEAYRVLRPGGQVRYVEHVAAPPGGWARVQRVLDATFWPRIAGGCHLGRDPREELTRAGFEMVHVEEYLLPARRSPVAFHQTVHAVKPA